jgi:tape measure domain-containing protein
MAETVADLAIKITLQAQELNARLGQVESRLGGLQSAVSKVGGFFGGLKSYALGATVALVGVATAAEAVNKAFTLAAEAERAEISLKAMTGSAGAAAELMRQIRAFATETPFESPELLAAAKQLIAFGTSAKQVVPTLRMLGDISSGIGAPIGDLAYLFGTLQAQGRAFTVDISQFAMRGVPIWQQLGKQFGVSTAEVRKLVETGKVGFEDVRQALEALTGPGGRFHGLTGALSQSMSGLGSTLKDTVNDQLRKFGEAATKAFDLKNGIRQVTLLTEGLGKAATALVDVSGGKFSSGAVAGKATKDFQPDVPWWLREIPLIGLGAEAGRSVALDQRVAERQAKIAALLEKNKPADPSSRQRLAAEAFSQSTEKLREQLQLQQLGADAIEDMKHRAEGWTEEMVRQNALGRDQLRTLQEQAKAQEQMQQRAGQLAGQAATPLQTFQAGFREQQALFERGLLGQAQFATLQSRAFADLQRAYQPAEQSYVGPRGDDARSVEAVTREIERLRAESRAAAGGKGGKPLADQFADFAAKDERASAEQIRLLGELLRASGVNVLPLT